MKPSISKPLNLKSLLRTRATDPHAPANSTPAPHLGGFLILNQLFGGYICRFLATVNQSYILQHYPPCLIGWSRGRRERLELAGWLPRVNASREWRLTTRQTARDRVLFKREGGSPVSRPTQTNYGNPSPHFNQSQARGRPQRLLWAGQPDH